MCTVQSIAKLICIPLIPLGQYYVSSFLTAAIRSLMNTSMSFFLVSLPMLTLKALIALDSGIPRARRTEEGLWEKHIH